MTNDVNAATLHAWLQDGQEIALLDVREHGQYGEGHPFFAVNLPYSRLELDAPRLVPRLATRTVLLDDGNDVAEKAARRLTVLGYSQLHVLDGGAPAWARAGHTLFKGVNLPSKTFGELVEHHLHTPQVSAQALREWLAAGDDLLLLDGRTYDEHHRMTIPGAVSLPNGELARHIDVLLDGDTRRTVVVHCAGRTRSIIGAEILRGIRLPNPVYALENGTQGWQLAGFELEHGSTRRAAAQTGSAHETRPTSDQQTSARQAAQWLSDTTRTTYVFDVRSAEEYEQRTLPGAVHAPGGQLLQATDHWVGTRHARILLLDDDGRRAPVIAHWLRCMGHEAASVEGGIDADLVVPARQAPFTAAPLPSLDAAGLRETIERGGVLIDLRGSLAYRSAHATGASWSIRPCISNVTHAAGRNRTIVLVADEPDVAALAAVDLRESGFTQLAQASWATCLAARIPSQTTPADPADAQAIDHLFFVHDRHLGNLDAARRYLAWEQGLIAQCSAHELETFRLDLAAR